MSRLRCTGFRWRPGGWLRASTALFGWLLLRAAAQATLVIALARLLGATEYGQFVTVLAIAGFLAPLAGLGLSSVLLRDGAREPGQLQRLLGSALALWLRASVLVGIGGVVVCWIVLPGQLPLLPVSALVLAEMTSISLVDLLARTEQSQHRTQRFGAMMAGLVLSRLGGLGLYALLGKGGVIGWMWVYAVASACYTAFLLIQAHRRYHLEWGHRGGRKLVRQGFPFALGALSLRLQAEFNKPLLAQLDYALAGNFNVAQRAVDLASLPLVALQEALWSRMYADTDHRRRLLRAGGALIALALGGGAILTLGAPLLPELLGADFGATAHLLVLLAWLPVLQVARNLSNAWIVAARQQQLLVKVYLGGGAMSIILTAWLISAYGLHGAVWAAYATEATVIGLQILLGVRRSTGANA